MKVLLVSLFHPEIVRGGAQQVAYELFDGLKRQPGIEPTLLAAVDPSYESFYKLGACITGFDGRPGEFLFLSRGYDHWWHKTSDIRLFDAYAEFLRDVQPDVVHFHHFLLFGVDLISYTRKLLPNAKIVLTLHEFMAICQANGHLVRTMDGSLCDHASPARCNQCFPNWGPEQFFMRDLWFKRHFEAVDLFTTPSRFMIEHYVKWGLPRQKLHHVTNGQRNYATGEALPQSGGPHNRFGFFGQMVDSKGVWLLLEAVQYLRAQGFTDFSVDINGDNIRYASEERRTEIELFKAAELALPPDQRIVSFNGSYEVTQLATRMAQVDWCVIPSVWYETFALVMSEAWMFGRPVIASNVGAMRERITDGVDGLHFFLGDVRDLAAKIRRAATEPGLWQQLHDGIKEPPGQDTMVNAMLGCYQASQTAKIAAE